MEPFQKKEPNFINPDMQQYIRETKSSKELIQKELDVNKGEQNLLQQRLELMKSCINDISSSDPQYSMLLRQIGMDQIELDELKIRESLLIQKLSSSNGNFL